jgi:hypothetical protein
MVGAIEAVKTKDLMNVRMGNAGVFAGTEDPIQVLLEKVGWGNF